MRRFFVVASLGLCFFARPTIAQPPVLPQDGSISLLPSDSAQEEVSILLVNKRLDRVLEDSPIAPIEDSDDVVREQLANGRIERHVALDAHGNYVNDGPFKQYDAKGTLVVAGQYHKGVRIGVWTKYLTDRKAALLQAYPYSKAKLPLRETVEFVDGKMHGTWLIEDADNHVISQIELQAGVRSGKSVWLHPGGGALYHGEYTDGQLNGVFLELDAKGKTVRELEYQNGKHISKHAEYYPDKSKKAEYTVLIGSPSTTLDDFDSLTLAGSTAPAESMRHGEFVIFHTNGKLKARGNYEHGKLSGAYETWYDHGQRECFGYYADDQLQGKWSWWFANGMRQSVANYQNGDLVGEALAWNQDGQKVTIETQTADNSKTSRR